MCTPPLEVAATGLKLMVHKQESELSVIRLFTFWVATDVKFLNF